MIYLDNAATSFPKPASVYDFMNEFFRSHGVNPGRASYDLSLEVERLVHETRSMLTRLFGGDDPKRLTFAYNASDALNMIVFGMVNPGDHVVTSTLEHNSVLRPLYHREQAGEIEVTYVPFDEHGFLDPQEIERAFNKRTRLVLLTLASNVLGTVQPIAAIGKRCRDAGIPFAVDASQGAGAIAIDMTSSYVDVLAFTGHKSLLGPTGIGGLCSRGGAAIRTTRFGGTGVDSARRFHLDEYPYRLECGTLNILGVAGLHAGVRWILERGLDQIHAHETELWQRLRAGLSEIEGATVYCANPLRPHIGVLSCNLAGWKAADVGKLLDVDYDIAVRTGLQCAPLVHEHLGTEQHGTIRFSIGPLNTAADIDQAIAAMREIAQTPL